MLLAGGPRWEDLSLRDAADVVYVALIEPAIHGSSGGLDQMLRKWDEILEEAVLDRDTFGTSTLARASTAKAEETWGQARKLDGPRRKRQTIERPVVASGNPLDAGVVAVMRQQMLEQQRAFAAAEPPTLPADDDRR